MDEGRGDACHRPGLHLQPSFKCFFDFRGGTHYNEMQESISHQPYHKNEYV